MRLSEVIRSYLRLLEVAKTKLHEVPDDKNKTL